MNAATEIRKICIVTGSRAEYGHLRWLARFIEDDPALTLQWLVTGTHLSPLYGLTYKAIEQDGFTIDEMLDVQAKDDSKAAVAKSVGEGVTAISEAFERLAPDIVVILGDRYEMLSAATSALIMQIPIAHLHGGELTEGAFDDAIRHAITKMAYWHFTAAEPYRSRVIQLGENPDRVFNFGAPFLDNLIEAPLPDFEDFRSALDGDIEPGFFLFTYHPVTLENEDDGEAIGEVLAALEGFPDRQVLGTGVNADPGNNVVNQALHEFARRHPDRVLLKESLGTTLYLAAMKFCAMVIGNSSSGMLEAPALAAPTVNIGNRQKGRLRAASVLDCRPVKDDIVAAITRALSPDFRDGIDQDKLPYGNGGASRKIKDVLKSANLASARHKTFHDIEETS